MSLPRYDELLIGFDAREMCVDFDETWSPDQKDTFLLKKEVDKPLSTDTRVWASVFGLYDVLEGPPQMTWRQGLWDDLQQMKDSLSKGWGAQWKPCWLIGITQLVTSEEKEELAYYREGIVPPERDKSWQFLGYDVSEMLLLSGLSNCGYRLDEAQLARERYAPHLNRYHLFTEQEKAFEFKKWADERDPGHGPFYLYGLYVIQRAGEEKSGL